MAVSMQRSESTTAPPTGEIRVTWNAKYKPHLCCAEYDPIPVLSGVFVSPASHLVAANGFILVSVPCTVEGAPSDWKGAIIPRDLFGLKQPTSTGTISVTDTSATTNAVLGGLVAKVSVNLIVGEFPNYQSVFEGAFKGTDFKPTSQIAFNLSLMSRVEKAMGEKNGMRVLPTAGGTGADGPLICVPYGDPDAIGLVMPMVTLGGSGAAPTGFSADELLKRLAVPS